jgi:hypothetical protein
MISEDQVFEQVKAVQAEHADSLMKLPNVIGVGIGYCRRKDSPIEEPALVVIVDHKVPVAQLAPIDIIPREIDGVPVEVREMGGFFSI